MLTPHLRAPGRVALKAGDGGLDTLVALVISTYRTQAQFVSVIALHLNDACCNRKKGLVLALVLVVVSQVLVLVLILGLVLEVVLVLELVLR